MVNLITAERSQRQGRDNKLFKRSYTKHSF